ncbi:MAG: hypothetical protein JJE51_13110 [Thermoanaerobaculia bacterium]|nr:hypothetical protein [Thermoanaerobaculia bacterium]
MRKRQKKKAEKREDGVSAAQRVMATIIARSERDAPKPKKKGRLGGKTPAMAAGLTDYVWTASDLLSLGLWFNQRAAA